MQFFVPKRLHKQLKTGIVFYMKFDIFYKFTKRTREKIVYKRMLQKKSKKFMIGEIL